MRPVRYGHRFLLVASLAILLAGGSPAAQDRSSQEQRREEWQKVAEILAALNVRPDSTVADVGAGDGFFTSRLARAVGPNGRVFAVDINDQALGRLRRRLQDEAISNVTVVKGTPADPMLPQASLDAALIVNAYHEMDQHQAMLAAIRRALKPDGRLVLVEPIRDSRRGRPRTDEARDHEIDPEYALGDARAAGFRIVGLQDPFTTRNADVEWLLTLQPAPAAPPASTPPARTEPSTEDLKSPALRISPEAFRKLSADGRIAIVDVRGREAFEAGHIPQALSIPLDDIERSVEPLRRLGKPIVTYCS